MDFEIRESDRALPLIFFFMGSILGMYIGKLLYDERFRYFHFVMVPDVIYQFDQTTAVIRKNVDASVDYYHLPTELSLEAFGKLFTRLWELRHEHRMRRVKEKKEKKIEDLERSLDSDIYLLSLEGENENKLLAQKEVILQKARDMK